MGVCPARDLVQVRADARDLPRARALDLPRRRRPGLRPRHRLAQQLGQRHATQETLQLEIAEAQTALDQLQAQTWGVWLHEDADATRYVVLPMGTLEVEGWPWTVQGQPAVLLSRE